MLPKKTSRKSTPRKCEEVPVPKGECHQRGQACRVVLFLCLAQWIVSPAIAQEVVVNRTILALFDSSEDYNRGEDDNLIHHNAELALNHLGMKVRYHDLAGGLPPEEKLADVHAILTWFLDHHLVGAREYIQWAIRQMRAGKRYVVLGNQGALQDAKTGRPTEMNLLTQFYRELGLKYRGDWTDNAWVIEIQEKDSDMVEFERTLEGETDLYEHFVSVAPGNKVFLRLKRTDKPHAVSDAVVTGPGGGFVLEGYAAIINYLDDQVRWRINPFRFFEEALGLQGHPRYDTTTLFGRRIFYSHIDGDGLRNPSHTEPDRLSGEIIRDEIIRAYELPITVSFITAEVDPRYLGSEKMIGLARGILSLDNVEAGAHGFSHPLDWEKQITSFSIKGYSRPLLAQQLGEAGLPSDSVYTSGSKVTAERGEYLRREIEDAVRYINEELVPASKQVTLNQWTGNCAPPAEAIDMTRRLGLKNINLGDGRFDRSLPSYTGLASLARQVDGRIQVQTSNANENIYTNGWESPFDRFVHLIETFRESERPTLVKTGPRRVLPMNIYYHFYSAENRMGLKALKKIYDYVLTQDMIPIFTSDYASLVEDFFEAEVLALPDGGWKFRHYGDLRTVRFDRVKRFPDFARSRGVLGFTVWEGYLYVHLEEGEEAVLYLSEQEPSSPYLKEASTVPRQWSMNEKGVSFETRGFGRGFYRFLNMERGTAYEVRVTPLEKGSGEYRNRFRSGRGGELEMEIPVRGEVRIEVSRAGRPIG